jgi:hypothetical protein
MLKRRHFVAVCLLATVAAAVPALMAHNKVTVVDDQGWTLASVNDMDGTMDVLTDGGMHPPIYEVNVLRPGTGVFDLHLEKPIPQDVFSAHRPMWLHFKARSAMPRKIRTALQDPQSEPWSSEVKLTSEWKEFRLPFNPATPSPGRAVLAFQLGGTAGEVAITEIKLERS